MSEDIFRGYVELTASELDYVKHAISELYMNGGYRSDDNRLELAQRVAGKLFGPLASTGELSREEVEKRWGNSCKAMQGLKIKRMHWSCDDDGGNGYWVIEFTNGSEISFNRLMAQIS